MPGLEAALIAAGCRPLPWCGRDDWHTGAWLDRVHPARDTAAEFLTRLLAQLPSGRRGLVVGGSTLTVHFNESWEGSSLCYSWDERARFLTEAGAADCALWAVPGARMSGIAWQLHKALQWESTPFRRHPPCPGVERRCRRPCRACAAPNWRCAVTLGLGTGKKEGSYFCCLSFFWISRGPHRRVAPGVGLF